MTGAARWGALVGLMAAAGVISIASALLHRRSYALYERIAPWLALRNVPAHVRAQRARRQRGHVRPALWLGMRRGLSVLTGADATVVRRLRAAGATYDEAAVHQFRVRQVFAAAALTVVTTLLIGFMTAGSALRPGAASVVIAMAAVSGVLLTDQRLTRRARQGRERMSAELPVLTELLSLAMTAGEPPANALARVGRSAHGPLAREFAVVADQVRGGETMIPVLRSMSDALALPSLGRLVDAMAVAVDRGAPIRDVLRAQAADLRSQTSRALLESAGRKEIAMLMPVVFLVMPMVVLVALYPGWQALSSVLQ